MNRANKVVLVITLALVVTLGFAVFGCSSDSTAHTPAQDTNVGSVAPDFQFYNSQEELVSLSDLRGEPVVLNFWATWCGPCVYEMPYLQEVHEEWSDNGLVLLTINMGGTSSEVKEFLQSHGLSLPVLLDTNRDLADRYNIRYVPTTFFIDRDGAIQAVKVGAFPNKEAMEGYFDKIMS
jgi:thiol-disulfide isomerase/thioredoxin